jgi:hypothetical protein
MKMKKTLLKQTAVELTAGKRLLRQKRRKAKRGGGIARANAQRTAEVVAKAVKSLERHRTLLGVRPPTESKIKRPGRTRRAKRSTKIKRGS